MATGGLCWAACGASVSNYYRGTSYDAEDVLELTQIATGVEELEGTPATVKAMFGKLGIYYTYLERRLTYSQALKSLDNGNLIMYGIRGPWSEGHAVILCGVFRINTSYGFIYMDSIVRGGYVLNYNDQTVATTTSGDFYYYAGYQGIYTEVFCSFSNLQKHYTVN